jgi:hypothetical protein
VLLSIACFDVWNWCHCACVRWLSDRMDTTESLAQHRTHAGGSADCLGGHAWWLQYVAAMTRVSCMTAMAM